MIFVPIVGSMIRKNLGFRGDGAPQLMYFKGEDFGVYTSPFSFYSGKWELRGERYFLGKGPYKALIVFFHGLGAGHRAYSREISALAKQGYLVYAYDNTGCGISEGTCIGNLAQAALDQKAFFDFLKRDPLAKGLDIYAWGHSWGGYMALTALLPEYGVSKSVSMAGFPSVYQAMVSSSPSSAKFKNSILLYQKMKFGKYGNIDVTSLMNQTKAKVLYIQDENDKTCPSQDCLFHFKKEVKNPNVSFWVTQNKGHQPYWSNASVVYYEELKNKYHIFGIKRDLKHEIDYSLLNQDDPKTMKRIIDFFDN